MCAPFLFNSTLTPTPMPRRKSPLRKRGKKGREWDSIRAGELKPQFFKVGITYCELGLPGCARDNLLGFAHLAKRRNCRTPESMREVVLLCNNCHDVVELQGEAKMNRILRSVIDKRG